MCVCVCERMHVRVCWCMCMHTHMSVVKHGLLSPIHCDKHAPRDIPPQPESLKVSSQHLSPPPAHGEAHQQVDEAPNTRIHSTSEEQEEKAEPKPVPKQDSLQWK